MKLTTIYYGSDIIRYTVQTFGCKVNQYDTQAMLEKFRAAGYEIVPFDADADVYVINTCTVTGTGDKKSLQLARRLRREHPDSALILAGCLAQRKPEELLETGARLVIGTQHRGEVVELLEKALRENTSINAVNELNATTPFEPLTITSQEEHTRATLKIQEGCNNHCTYCIIPSVRGPIRSRPVDEIRAEAERLAQAGFTELVLTGIHLTSYGRDFTPRQTLLDAIRAVQDVPGVRRIRLGSLEPTVATVEFAQALRTMDKVCPQFHLALQSGSDTVLQRMARRYNMRMYRQAMENLRAVYPMAAFTTDVLTGFPGETEEDFEQLMDFTREMAFDRMGAFAFSPEEDTPAAAMPGQIDEEVKQERLSRLMTLQAEISAQRNALRIGTVEKVLVTGQKGTLYTARSAWEAPDADGEILLRSAAALTPGQFAQAQITGADTYDLTAQTL